MANKKYLDEVGVAYLINLLNDYPDNEILAALIDAVQDGLDEKQDKPLLITYNIGKMFQEMCGVGSNEPSQYLQKSNNGTDEEYYNFKEGIRDKTIEEIMQAKKEGRTILATVNTECLFPDPEDPDWDISSVLKVPIEVQFDEFSSIDRYNPLTIISPYFKILDTDHFLTEGNPVSAGFILFDDFTSEIEDKEFVTKEELADVATSGDYEDLINTPGLATQFAPGLMSSMDKTILDGFNPNVSANISNIAVNQFEIINAKQENAISIENTIEPQVGAQIRTSNLLDVDTFTPGFYIGSSGSLATNANDHVGDFIPVTPGDDIYYTGVIGPTSSASINRRLHVYTANQTWIKQLNFAGGLKVGDSWSTHGIVPSNGAYVRVSWGVEDTNVMISVGAPAKYEPYYLKPFAVLTDTTVNVSSDNTVENTNSYQIDFPAAAGNVYSAIVHPVEGKLYVTSGHISSYNGEILTTQWWSDRDTYVEGNSPTTGAEVVYALDEEDWEEYDITPVTIPLFYRQNYISVDLGVITSLTYYAETFGVRHLTASDGITMGQTNIVEQDIQNWNNTAALINTKADLDSPMFTGTPMIDHAPGRSDGSLRIATAGFVQNLGNNITKVETALKATQNYAAGDYVIVQGVLYKVTTAITSGTTISSGVNATPTTVMDEIKALISAINS